MLSFMVNPFPLMHPYHFLKQRSLLFLICTAFTLGLQAQVTMPGTKPAGAFPLVSVGQAAFIRYDTKEETVVRIAAQALKDDITSVSGSIPGLDSMGSLQPYTIIIGTVGKHGLVDRLVSNKKLDVAKLKGQWETFSLSVIDQPFNGVKQALVIAGSDARGTAFGVFELSKRMGVSPLYWWADVTPLHRNEIFFTKGSFISTPPSVRYRGIFINDEDWGLQPWAAKTLEPETGDIGPRTYAKVFQLLLRLKANLIWPAMHPSTKAFFHYPGNIQVAADYGIIIGSSHAEPMLRNNVGEWDEKTMGHFNYVTNKEKVYRYWEERVQQSRYLNAMYTMGMRGVHDSKMEGVKDEKEAVPLLEKIIAEQREMLARNLAKNITQIPQVFTAYKEVLDIYDAGLKIPGDITLVWPDDNYGYIQRLNNEKEKSRPGGSGVYYHASYWGRPHDYLWLGTMHPSLMREEMMKAYANGAKSLWVLNVGDIKPLEYSITEFLDMAYDAVPFMNSEYGKKHLYNWVADIFGKEKAGKIESVLWRYYQLAFERKPEFMGWSQTEPTTKTNYTQYNHFDHGDEAQRRIDQYAALEKDVKFLRDAVDPNRRDAFYQLVYYPVRGASLLNKKFLYRDKAALYAQQKRLSAADYAAASQAAYDSIVAATEYYNTVLSNGKWNGIMSMKPRNLPVYLAPELPAMPAPGGSGWNIAPEGVMINDSSLPKNSGLPAFDDIHKQQYFIDIFLAGNRSLTWSATFPNWIRLSQNRGTLSPSENKKQFRLRVNINWNKFPAKDSLSGHIIFRGADIQLAVAVHARKLNTPGLSVFKGFIENNGSVSMHAGHFSRRVQTKNSQWNVLGSTGYTGEVVQAALSNPLIDTTHITTHSARVEYDFYTFIKAAATLFIYTLPTLPLNNNYGMRYAVAVDGGPLSIVDFRTVGRSEEWKQNVLRNRAERKISLPMLAKGKHILKIFAIDPGVMLDEIRLDLGGLKYAYGAIPETRSR